MEDNTDSGMDDEHPPSERKGKNQKCCHLFNCDKTYSLDVVENLLKVIKGKLSFDISILTKKYFGLHQMSELCKTIQSGPPMDFAIFVVHANESRLSINEENAGIGYARFYKALLQAADERVIVVIGGDDNYKNPTEEDKALLSRWAKRQISSQFKDEFMDGRKSFIFSWNKTHRPIHEEALLHFLDPGKTGKKFEPKLHLTTPLVDTTQMSSQATTSKASCEVDLKAKTEIVQVNYSNIQPVNDEIYERQKAEAGRIQENAIVNQHRDRQQPKRDEPMQVHYEGTSGQYCASGTESAYNTRLGATAKDTPGRKIAIVCRDQSDTTIIKDVFGDEVLGKVAIFSGCPDAGLNSLLSTHSMKSCFIVVEARTLVDELYHKSIGTPYEDLLKTARETVEGKVVIIICSDNSKMSQNEENAITYRIKQLLGDKGVILWWKENINSPRQTQNPQNRWPISRSISLPDDGTTKKSLGFDKRSLNPEEYTLLLKTRLRHGKISYQKEDVEKRLNEWRPAKQIEDNLMKTWGSTADAELLIYQENRTGSDRVVVKEGSKILQLSDSLKDVWQNISASASCLRPLMGKRRDSSSSNDTLDGMDLD